MSVRDEDPGEGVDSKGETFVKVRVDSGERAEPEIDSLVDPTARNSMAQDSSKAGVKCIEYGNERG